MTQADRIRQYVFDRYIRLARASGRATVKVRAGDVHAAMGLANSMPAVCSALRSAKFNILAGVTTTSVTGPQNGANVFFEFGLAPENGAFQRDQEKTIVHIPQADVQLCSDERRPVINGDSYSDAIVLVSCVRSKLSKPAPARLLYCSDWFLKARSFVESKGLTWFVLSALHGVISPDTEIAPYEQTLNTASIEERRKWAEKVWRQLNPLLTGKRRILFFAGQRYRELLTPILIQNGYTVEVPMEGLRIGEQLSWLSAPR